MQININEVMLYITSNISFSDHSFYESYIENYMKQNNINNRIFAVDACDKEIERIIKKYFETSNKKDFLLFLLNIKYIILDILNKQYFEYAFFLCELIKWWDDSMSDLYKDKFKWNDELYRYLVREINEIELNSTIRPSFKLWLSYIRSQIYDMYNSRNNIN